jgi:anti-sigma B factor antagonist
VHEFPNTRPGAFPLSWESRELRPDIHYLAVSGELDIHTTPLLLDTLARPELVRVTDLVVDLAGVTFFGVAGINALIAVARLRRHRRTHLVGVMASPGVRRVVEITGADDLLTLHRDLDSCLRLIEQR